MTAAERREWLIQKYVWLRSQTERGKRSLKDLLALAPHNDPFNVMQDGRIEKAYWFAAQWQQFGTRGSHLRRLHYRMVSANPRPLMPDGSPYVNTDLCWTLLIDASKNARYLALIDPTALIERRSAEAIVHAPQTVAPAEPAIEQLDANVLDLRPPDSFFSLPSFNRPVSLRLPVSPSAKGYDYLLSDQPFTIELWIEKSTMNDVLEPLSEELGLNLVVGTGFASVTRIVELVGRITKPVRIFTISDFDPAGEHMPTAIARQLEFWRQQYAPASDVALHILALTAAQVQQYGLPGTPIKATDKRKTSFENRHGSSSAIELDALEALHPGSLARLVREAVSQYRDPTLRPRLQTAKTAATTAVRQAWQARTEPYRVRLAELESDINAILVEHDTALQEELAPHAAAVKDIVQRHRTALTADLAPHDLALEEIQLAIRRSAEGFAPDLPPRPRPEVQLPDESGCLFASHRAYLEQLKHYKRMEVT